MTGVVGSQKTEFRIGFVFCLLLAVLGSLACSIPNLDAPECTESRDVVREFYSYHFGNDMAFSPENLEKRSAYLTPAFLQALRGRSDSTDPFTLTSDLPKAFRVGECKVTELGKRTNLQILLFWKDDTRSEQRSINVGVENVDGKWLIGSVSQ